MANNTVNALQTDGTSVWAGGLFTTDCWAPKSAWGVLALRRRAAGQH